jgi:hypothetical protein
VPVIKAVLSSRRSPEHKLAALRPYVELGEKSDQFARKVDSGKLGRLYGAMGFSMGGCDYYFRSGLLVTVYYGHVCEISHRPAGAEKQCVLARFERPDGWYGAPGRSPAQRLAALRPYVAVSQKAESYVMALEAGLCEISYLRDGSQRALVLARFDVSEDWPGGWPVSQGAARTDPSGRTESSATGSGGDAVREAGADDSAGGAWDNGAPFRAVAHVCAYGIVLAFPLVITLAVWEAIKRRRR